MISPSPLDRSGPIGHTAGGHEPQPLTFAYEVEFLLENPSGDVGELRGALATMGDSLAIVGGDALYRVHIHTDRPDEVLAGAAAAGTIREAATTSLEEQVADCLGHGARGVQAGASSSGLPGATACALIAVLEPSGVADAIRSLGAIIVEPAGDDERTVERIGEVLVSTPARSAVGLVEASHADLLAADPRLVELAFVVVSSLPAAISAAAEFHPGAAPIVNVVAMGAAAKRCRTAEVDARPGSADGTPDAVADAVADLVAGAQDAEVLTVVAGAEVADELLAAATAAVTRRFPDLRVETLRGGRRDPAYQVGLE